MHRGLRIGTVAVAAIGALAACSGGGSVGGNPPASSAPSSAGAQTSAATGTANGAPKVATPLRTDGIAANPCSALTTAQMTELGVAPPGRSSTTQAGPSCMWQAAANPSNSASIGVMTANKNGLSDIYANHSDGKYAYFEPVPVDGYPGVYAEQADERAKGYCSVWIGVTDQLAVGVSVILLSGANQAHPCDSANKIGTAMIEHLKGAA